MNEVPYINPYKNKGHHCDVLLIGCMDFRFHQYLIRTLELLLSLDEISYDFRGVVGGSKAVVDQLGRRQIFKSINLAMKKHGVGVVVLADHIDCGAYGGSSLHLSEEAEEKFHLEQLRRAKKILQKRFPELKVVLVYQDWHTVKIVK